MAGLPWVSVGDNCRLTQCWRSAILSDFGAPPRQRTPRPLKCELRPHLRKSWRGRVHCQGRAKRARRVALTVDSSPPIHTQEGEADPKSRPSFTHYFCDRAIFWIIVRPAKGWHVQWETVSPGQQSETP